MPNAAAGNRAAAGVAESRKRLAVFCDGTWNDLRMKSLTNVARLAKCVEPYGWDGRRQIVFYDSGVGVATGVSHLADRIVSVLGGAIGAGLDDKIESAYRFLVLNYEPGDEIFVFGFSRGAYTARSLCGLIRKCGILRRGCLDRIPEAMALYRETGCKPGDAKPRQFRADHACKDPQTGRPIATGAEDFAGDPQVWAGRAVDFALPSAGEANNDFVWLPPDPPPLGIYRLMYLGVWDTVGSMGIPPTIPFLSAWVNRRYKFYDTDASSLLFSIRHACALDEDRKVFDITPVKNIGDLNTAWAAAHGRQVDRPAEAATFVAYSDRPFQQRWFPGSHGSVGGGNPERGLSGGALVWVAVGALRAGLKFDWGEASELGRAKRERDPVAPYRIRPDPRDPTRAAPLKPWEFDFIGYLTGYRDRVGKIPGTDLPKHPTTEDELNFAAKERVRRLASYRPATLEFYTGEVQPTPLHRTVARLAMGLTLAGLAAAAALAMRHLTGR